MDLTKKGRKVYLVLPLSWVARIHKFYLQGFQWSIESQAEIQKSNEFIAELEKIMIREGYMTEAEVKARHADFTKPAA